MKGEAEAFAIEAKAKAEAEQMEKKANAWKEYEDAAVVDMILDVLPKVCHLWLHFLPNFVENNNNRRWHSDGSVFRKKVKLGYIIVRSNF